MKQIINFLNKDLLKNTEYLAIGPNTFIENDDVEYDILIINKKAKDELTVPKKYVKLIIECKTTGGYTKTDVINSYNIFKKKYKKKINFVYFAIYSPINHLKEFLEEYNIKAFAIKKYNVNNKGEFESQPLKQNFKAFINFLEKVLKLK